MGEHEPETCTDPDCMRIGCVAHRALARAIAEVNRQLHIDALLVLRHDALKCWVHDDEEGGRHKTYLSAGDCVALASAFTTIASCIERTVSPSSSAAGGSDAG